MSSLFTLQNSPIIDLYEIKINDFEGYFSFHGSKNLEKDIVFKGRTYIYLPCELSNLDYTSEQKQNRPTFKISNVNNFITNLIKDRDDLLMKKFYRKKIFAKDLDLENFDKENNPLGQDLFTSYLSIDTFIIQKKNFENKDEVEFVLSNILDVEGQTCPSRKVYNDSCQWLYRGFGCGYGKGNPNEIDSFVISSSDYTSLTGNANSIVGNSINSLSKSNILAYFRADDGLTINGTVNELDKALKTKTFDKVSNWNFYTGASLTSQNLTLDPAPSYIYDNITYGSGIKRIVDENNNTGVLLKPFLGGENVGFNINKADSITIPINIFSGNQNEDLTIIYVYKFSDILLEKGWSPNTYPNGGKQDGFFTSDNGQNIIGDLSPNGKGIGNIGLGWGNRDQFSQGDTTIKNNVGEKRMVTLINNKTANQYSFYKNANILKDKSSYVPNTAFASTQFGFNLPINSTSSSEVVLYEVMIFNKVLNQNCLNNIHSYLSYKYKINIPSYYQNQTIVSSSSFFPSDSYNLGVPMADENNKIFLTNQGSAFKFYENYNLFSLVYRGDYDKKKTYVKGDFVKVDPNIDFDFNQEYQTKQSEIPSSFFVCVNPEGGKSIGQHPYNFTKVWREDKCSKSLNGCKLRFKDVLPFGAFPGTVPYEYKFPGGS